MYSASQAKEPARMVKRCKKSALLPEFPNLSQFSVVICSVIQMKFIHLKKTRTIMKKVLVVFAAIFACIQFSMAGDVITQDVMQLPLTARNFINRYFTNPQVSYIKIESEILQSKKYEVTLSDRTELEFDSKGNWLEVDCKKTTVPAALVPNFAKKYVEANFPGQIITKIENKRGIEIELANDLSFRFNKKGKLVKMDD